MVDGCYVACFRDTKEYSIHKKYWDAVAWLREMWDAYREDGCYSEDTYNGKEFIAKIIRCSKSVITDALAKCETRDEEWDCLWDEFGEAVMVPIDTEAEKK